MKVEEMPPPRSSSRKRDREEEDEKRTKMEKKAGQSTSEKYLIESKVLSATASPVRTEKNTSARKCKEPLLFPF